MQVQLSTESILLKHRNKAVRINHCAILPDPAHQRLRSGNLFSPEIFLCLEIQPKFSGVQRFLHTALDHKPHLFLFVHLLIIERNIILMAVLDHLHGEFRMK